MTRPRPRTALAALAVAGLASFLVWGLLGLPDFGDYRGPYGLVLNRVEVAERHATDIVAAVVFDYRGLDTIGEELILFGSAMAVALLLREVRVEETEHVRDPVRSEALRTVGLGIVGAFVVLALYVIAHGYVTPGGGFQGGVIVAVAAALVYLAGEYRAYCRLTPSEAIDAAEGAGAGGFVAVGIAALASGAAFLENVLPLGKAGTLAAGGTIPLVNGFVALAVAAAFVLLFGEFLEEVMVERSGES